MSERVDVEALERRVETFAADYGAVGRFYVELHLLRALLAEVRAGRALRYGADQLRHHLDTTADAIAVHALVDAYDRALTAARRAGE